MGRQYFPDVDRTAISSRTRAPGRLLWTSSFLSVLFDVTEQRSSSDGSTLLFVTAQASNRPGRTDCPVDPQISASLRPMGTRVSWQVMNSLLCPDLPETADFICSDVRYLFPESSLTESSFFSASVRV